MNLDSFKNQDKAKQNAIVAAGVEEFSRKSYGDARTDLIVQRCGISKGLLFHYFGSKKEFYLYCLSRALEKLIEDPATTHGSFYEIIFAVMDEKLKLCARYSAETRFVNLASRESAAEVASGKSEILKKYAAQAHITSSAVMALAVGTLPLKTSAREKAKEGLLLYTSAVINKYLLAYQNTPDRFFQNAEVIKAEIKAYIDLMLNGIARVKIVEP